jgi:hypothetical protein
MMAHLPVRYRILTLQTSLEEVFRLGDGYLVSDDWQEWQARDLLTLLVQHHPDLLSWPVALVLPDATGAGAIFELDQEGEPITTRPFYRIERRPPIADSL